MQNLKERRFRMRRKRTIDSPVISFVPAAEIDLARREILAAGIDDTNFSDKEITIALQKKGEVAAHTVVPVIIDWLIRKDFIHSSNHAIQYLIEKKQSIREDSFRSVGAPEFDSKGKFFMIALLSESLNAKRFYKVYTDGIIQELWAE